MTTLGEVSNLKVYTEERHLCPYCNQNKNFLFVVKEQDDKYYLLEMCPRCMKHAEDVREIPSRQVKDYPAPTK